MSDDVKLSLRKVGIVAGAAAAIVAISGTFLILPYRMTAAERRLEMLEAEARTSRELLSRIDENVKALKERAR